MKIKKIDKYHGVRTAYTSLLWNTLIWMMKTNINFTEKVLGLLQKC